MIARLVNRPVLVSVVFLVVLIMGFYSFRNLPIEMVPDESLPSTIIIYSWNGASPDMILEKVVMPVEEVIGRMKGIKSVKSTARENRARLEVEFLAETDMDFAMVALRERLNRLQRDLPAQVQKPDITSVVPEEFKKKAFLTLGVYGDDSIYALRNQVEREVIPFLRAQPGVERIDLFGGVPPEIKISLDLARLRQLGIPLGLISARLYENFYTLNSISLRDQGRELLLLLSAFPEDLAAVDTIVLAKTGNKELTLGEIAEVSFGFEEMRTETRFQGKPIISIDIYKEREKGSIAFSRLIKGKLAAIAARLGGETEFIVVRDDSRELAEKLRRLVYLALYILIIIFVILIMIIGDLRSTLIVFSSVFFSVFFTFTAIYLFSLPLNILTLSGLALGFGLFVDNAVVVFDSILRLREQGLEARTAAAQGAAAVFLPVLTSTLTTIIVFFSFAYFQGRLRLYYLPLAYIITLALISSVLVAFTLIPSLSSRLPLRTQKRPDIKTGRGRFFAVICRHPLIVLIPLLTCSWFTYSVFKDKVSFGRFFGWEERQELFVQLFFPKGFSFDESRKTILLFEEQAFARAVPKTVETRIFEGRAFMSISFPTEIEYSHHPYALKQELISVATNLAGIGAYVYGFGREDNYFVSFLGNRSFFPHSIRFKAFNYEKMRSFLEEFAAYLEGNRRVMQVEIDTDPQVFFAANEKYFALRPDMEKLKQFNLQADILVPMVQSLLNQRMRASRLRLEERDMYVEIKADNIEDLELHEILETNLQSPAGMSFRLQDVVTVSEMNMKSGIARENQEFLAAVRWDYAGSSRAGERFFNAVYENLELPPGFTKSLEERRFMMTGEEKGQLHFAIILALFMVYLFLGMLYESFIQPLLIMLAIPLALIGVAWAFILSGTPFDSSAYIGVILLSGIVVNNAILLVDNINRQMRGTGNMVMALTLGVRERIRPILMTTLTTVLGMLPLVLFHKAGTRDIWSSLALCIVGGLTVSTVLIFFVVPLFYCLFQILGNWLRAGCPISLANFRFPFSSKSN